MRGIIMTSVGSIVAIEVFSALHTATPNCTIEESFIETTTLSWKLASTSTLEDNIPIQEGASLTEISSIAFKEPNS